MQAQAPLLSLFNLAVHHIPTSISQLSGSIGAGETQRLDQEWGRLQQVANARRGYFGRFQL